MKNNLKKRIMIFLISFILIFFYAMSECGTSTKAATGNNPQGVLEAVSSNAFKQITVGGWAFDRDNTWEQLKIQVYVGGAAGSGAPMYEIKADAKRSDVNAAYPNVGIYHGFSCDINVNETGTKEVYVYAVNIGGGSDVLLGKKTVTIKSDSNNPQGVLEAVSSNAFKQITVGGWAFDRDNTWEQLKIQVYVGGAAGSGAPMYEIKADAKRSDVNAAYPNVGIYHGFSCDINVNETGTKEVYVYAVNIGGGSDVLLGKKTVTIKSDGYNPQGDLDEISSYAVKQITVRGWAFDRDNTWEQLKIRVYVGGAAESGAPMYEIKADASRPDVNQAYPNVGIYHGFFGDINVNETGTKEIYVYAVNIDGGSDVLLGTKTVTIKADGHNPQGVLEAVSSNAVKQITVGGWAFDRDNTWEQLKIHVYIDGRAGSGAPMYEIKADAKRIDVNAAYPNVGIYHGFSCDINVNETGTRTIYVYAVSVGGGSDVLLGTKTVTINEQNNNISNSNNNNTSATIQDNIYNLAMESIGNKGTTYQTWAGLNSSQAWCAAYATYIANQAMIKSGYSKSKALSIVPKQTSTSKMAGWYNERGRYYSYAAWSQKGVRVKKNTKISSYDPQIGDLAVIENGGNNGTSLPDHTAIVIAKDNNSITLAEGNMGGVSGNHSRTSKVCTYTYYKKSQYWQRSPKIRIFGFCNPEY